LETARRINKHAKQYVEFMTAQTHKIHPLNYEHGTQKKKLCSILFKEVVSIKKKGKKCISHDIVLAQLSKFCCENSSHLNENTRATNLRVLLLKAKY